MHCSYHHRQLRFPGGHGLDGSPAVLFVHLFRQRTFRDRWHRHAFLSLSQLRQSTEGNSKQWPKPGKINPPASTFLNPLPNSWAKECCSFYPSSLTPVQGYHSPDRKNPRTFPDFSRRNCDNKCTFIDTKSASYEVSVAFRQLSKANSKRWTSDMQKELQYE